MSQLLDLPKRSLDEVTTLCQKVAADLGVAYPIHPEDFIWKFIAKSAYFNTNQLAADYYFNDGARSAKKLVELLSRLYGTLPTDLDLLEFASGYGCITRHLSKSGNGIRVTSCDIHPAAISFIRDELESPAILSVSKPEKFVLQQKYDVVFALSFFSHMPRKTWVAWVRALLKSVEPGGFLIFTTHGLESRKHLGSPEIGPDGFWFLSESEQKDLSADEYGSTVVTPRFVITEVEQMKDLGQLKMFQEAFWWEHQDLYVIKRCELSPSVSNPAASERPKPIGWFARTLRPFEGEGGVQLKTLSAGISDKIKPRDVDFFICKKSMSRGERCLTVAKTGA